MLLANKKLKDALDAGDLIIDPKPKELKAASIDLTLGEEAFFASEESIRPLGPGKLLVLPAGEMAIVITREKLQLKPNIVGHIGLRSHFARKGLVLLAGPQIDPGFHGNLHLTLCNLSPTEVALSYGQEFCTVEFHILDIAAEKPYGVRTSDLYQEQAGITPEEIEDIKQRRGYALSEIFKGMQSMAKDVSGLKDSVDKYMRRSDKYFIIFISILAIFVATIIALVAVVIKQVLAG